MKLRVLGYGVLAAAAVAAVAWLAWPKAAQPLRASVVAELGGDAAGFARAERPAELSFPADHGPHPDYQTEWWYYTGNLDSETGEHFGYQLTFFRRALAPPAARAPRESAWATGQVYMAHLALTDVAGGRHGALERLARGAAGLAGAQADPFRVWLEDWSVTAQADGAWLLQARAGEFSLALTLRDAKGPVLQGDRGYSRKGPEPGNASYYYSLTRLATEGRVSARGRTFTVRGLSWMDHEFSTSALGAEQAGWDWFSLQMSDGRELMLFRLRRADGSPDGFSSGTLVGADGTVEARLGHEDFSIEATGRWRSPHTGAVYPAGWTITAPAAGLRLALEPYLAGQEMDLSYAYWEGAVRVTGSVGGAPVTGNGYVELTGYATSMQGQPGDGARR